MCKKLAGFESFRRGLARRRKMCCFTLYNILPKMQEIGKKIWVRSTPISAKVSMFSSNHFVEVIFVHSSPRFILWWFSEHSSLVGTHILRLSRLLQQQKHLRRERSDRLQLPPRSIQQKIITVWVNDPEAPAANIARGFESLKSLYRNYLLGSCGLKMRGGGR